jgi:hypothetical protein
MNQTAVNWLIEQLEKEYNSFPLLRAEDCIKAIEMEKEQIVNAFEIGYDNGACVQEGNAIYHGSNYYKETFKSE